MADISKFVKKTGWKKSRANDNLGKRDKWEAWEKEKPKTDEHINNFEVLHTTEFHK